MPKSIDRITPDAYPLKRSNNIPVILFLCICAGFLHPSATILTPAYAEDGTAASSVSEADTFARWLDELRQEALGKGISESTLDATLSRLKAPTKRIIELDRNQPEQKLTLATYLEQRLTPERIAKGKAMLQQHAPYWNRSKSNSEFRRDLLWHCGDWRPATALIPGDFP